MSQHGDHPADPGSDSRERVLCHGCDNEWYRADHGLECPRCHSDFVEIIDPTDDPRSETSYTREVPANRFPGSPLHGHNPWRDVASDPDEEDIDHVAFSPAPGVHFQRTFIRSGGPRTTQRARAPNDETVGSLFQTLGTFLHGPGGPNPDPPSPIRAPGSGHAPQFSSQHYPFAIGSQPPMNRGNPANPMNSPNRVRTNFSVSVGHGGGRNTWTTEDRLFPPLPQRNQPNDPFVGLQAMMQTMLQQMQGYGPGMHGGHQRGPPGHGGPGIGLPEMLAQIFQPMHGVHGDAVYSQEDFDRVIGQMMEQQNGSTAPGPASEAAISALPKKKVEKSMMGSDGKAECSVCMDNVEIGDEVTVLPCNHWFHQQCVSIWLKEHDTCPHCRKGITPAEDDPDPPRLAGQNTPDPGAFPNRQSLQPLPQHILNHPAAPFTQPGMQHPYVPGGYPSYPDPSEYVRPPPHRPQPPETRLFPGSFGSHDRLTQASRRSPSSSARSQGEGSSRSASGGSGGVSGWFRNLRNGGRNTEG